MTARTPRSIPLDSGPMPLDQGERKKYVRFDPTLNTGHIAQIVLLVVGGTMGFAAIKADQLQQKADLEQVKAVATVERAQTAAALAEIKVNIGKLQEATGDIKESLAVLKGRAAETGGRK